MFHFSQASSQSSPNLSEGMGLTQLAEEHGNELIPRTKAFGSFFRLGFSDHFFEFIPVKISRIWPKMLLHLFIDQFTRLVLSFP